MGPKMMWCILEEWVLLDTAFKFDDEQCAGSDFYFDEQMTDTHIQHLFVEDDDDSEILVK